MSCGRLNASTLTGDLGCCVDAVLSNQQLQVVSLVAAGLSNKQVAKSLHLSNHTVAAYISTAMLRLGVANRAGLVARCYYLGVLDVVNWPPQLAKAPRPSTGKPNAIVQPSPTEAVMSQDAHDVGVS